jgi:hypothetical protein
LLVVKSVRLAGAISFDATAVNAYRLRSDVTATITAATGATSSIATRRALLVISNVTITVAYTEGITVTALTTAKITVTSSAAYVQKTDFVVTTASV